MRKLYTDPNDTVSVLPPTLATEAVALYPEVELHQLKHTLEGYCNAATLYDDIAHESYHFVDTKNKALYNAYTALLADKLGVGMPVLKKLATEALEGSEGIATNHDIALEGFLGTLWEKIKGFFKKIYEAIKAFFSKHFTRLGKVKKSLENMKKVLAKTEKAFVPPEDLKYTGSLLKRYAGYSNVSQASVEQSLSSVATLVGNIKKVNESAKEMANRHLVDKDFFTRIKSLTETSSAANARKDDVDNSTPGFVRSRLSGQKREERADKKAQSKSLGEIASKADAEGSKMEGEVANASVDGVQDDQANLDIAKKQMGDFMKTVVEVLKPSIGAKLISGKTISKVDVSEAFELEVDMADDAQEADGVNLSGKGGLITLVDAALGVITTTEADIKVYGDINDTIMKNLETVDKLIKDIDRIDPAKYGPYKKVVNTQVRERLMLMQRFFSAYNKVGKNVLELSMDSCEGTVDYCLLSMKYFK